ncbi:MAG: hypothetical protein KY475_02255 [Planctomycetes bacterium]|nr:hypothetical protein [Planctomycetota bacterium]
MPRPVVSPSDASRNPKPTKRRWRRWLFSIAVLLLVLVAAAPYVAEVTPVRDRIVDAVAERQNVRAEVGGASFGWFTPLELRDVRVESLDGEPLLNVDRIRAERPLWELALSGENLGRFLVEQPEITLIASEEGWNFEGIGPPPGDDPALGAEPARKPELIADVNRAALRLYRTGVDDALVDVSGVDVSARVRYMDDTRWLIVEPFQPLDHKPLTPEMCRNGLELIAPILASAAWVEGNVSLQVDELRLPLNRAEVVGPSPTALAGGELTLHSVETGLRNPILQEIAAKVASLFEVQTPSRVRLAEESQVQFKLRDRRVYHEGLAFGLPEINPSLLFRTSGTVGLDRTLDLRVEVPIALDMAFSGPIAQRLSGKTLKLAVGGTLDEPTVSLVPETTVVRQIAELLRETPDGPSSAGDKAGDSVAELAEEVLPLARNVGENVADVLGDTVARIRERRAARRAAREEMAERSSTSNDRRMDEAAEFSGDALPPPPPEEESGDDEEAEGARRQGLLRRFFNRTRRSDR